MFTFECGVDSVLSLSFYGSNVIETESDLGERRTIFIDLVTSEVNSRYTYIFCVFLKGSINVNLTNF